REIANSALVVEDAGLFTAARAEADELHGALSPGGWKGIGGEASIMHAGGRQARRGGRSSASGFLTDCANSFLGPAADCCPSATCPDYRSNSARLWGFAGCNPLRPRTGLPYALGPRASCKRRGIRGATRWRGSILGALPGKPIRGGCDEAGASRPCSR